MNIFDKMALAEHVDYLQLGTPVGYERSLVRAQLWSRIRNGNGFMRFPLEPKKDKEGLTRGDKKRAARKFANSKVSEDREIKFQHSCARQMNACHV